MGSSVVIAAGDECPAQTMAASVLWEFSVVSAGRSKSILRTSIVLTRIGGGWSIVLAQLTRLALGLEAAG